MLKRELCPTDETPLHQPGCLHSSPVRQGAARGPPCSGRFLASQSCAWTHIQDLAGQLLCHSRAVPGPSLSSPAPHQGLATYFHGVPRECLGSRQRSCSKSHTQFLFGVTAPSGLPCAPWSGARGQSQASSSKPLRISSGLRPGTTLRMTHCPAKPSGGPGPALPQLSSSTGQSLDWTCRRDSQVEVTGPSFGTLSADS